MPENPQPPNSSTAARPDASSASAPQSFASPAPFHSDYSASSAANRKRNTLRKLDIWARGLIAAAVSGAAGGVLTGLAAVGIDPSHFNLQSGIGATLRIGFAASIINAVIGVAAYLQKSPLPERCDDDRD